jgi:hypothetical protein
MTEANQVPLVELLAAVPADIRIGVDDGNDWKAGTTWHPVGLLCQEAAAELRRLEAVNAQLLEALEDAADDIEAWGAYASGYFQTKHDLLGAVTKARAAIKAAKGGA